jgi:hypothetical protein
MPRLQKAGYTEVQAGISPGITGRFGLDSLLQSHI